MEIFKLFGSILINTDEADKSLSKTDKNAKSFGETLGNGIKTAGKWAAAVGTAAVGAATGMYKMATNAASTADNIDKMSQKIGISREAYQELDFILSQSGTDVDKLQSGMKTMSAQVEKNSSNFEKLGVSLKNANGEARSQEEIFYDTVNALQQMQEGTEKSTIAAELFGKAGTELMPLLNSEAGSLEAMREQAHELGLVLDDELVDNGVNLTDALDQMKRSIGSVMTQLGARLMPIVEKAADFITAQMPKINKLVEGIAPIVEEAFDEILPVILELAEDLLPQLISIVTALLPPISRIFSALTPIISSLISKLAPIIVKIVDKLLPPLVDIIDALTPVLDIVLELLDPILDLLDTLLDPLADLLRLIAPLITLGLEIINAVLTPLKPLIQAVADLLGDKLGGAVETVAGLFGGFLDIVNGVLSFLSGDYETGIQKAANGMVDMFSNAFGAIDALFGTNFQKWYDETTTFFEGVGKDLYNMLHPDAGQAKWSYEDALARLQNDPAFAATPASESSFDAQNYYASHYKTPKLAGGGIIHGKTLAVVGDNENVRSDPEVVAPLSDLEELAGTKEILDELREIVALLRELLGGGDGKIIMDGEKVASIVVNKINKMRYTRGSEVIFSS